LFALVPGFGSVSHPANARIFRGFVREHETMRRLTLGAPSDVIV